MKKSDLKSGMHSVVFKNGKSAFYDAYFFKLDESESNDLISLNGYNEDLTHIKSEYVNMKDWDVVSIFETKQIWQREEKEMIVIDGVEYELDFVKKCIGNQIFFEEIVGATDDETPKDYEKKIKDEADRLDINKDNKPSFNEPEKYVINYGNDGIGVWMPWNDEIPVGYVNDYDFGNRKFLFDNGVPRKTKENAEYSQKRNRRANRLEALVEELQGELGVGDYYICFDNFIREDLSSDFYEAGHETRRYEVGERTELIKSLDLIPMKKETAERICELLNNERYSLDGE